MGTPATKDSFRFGEIFQVRQNRQGKTFVFANRFLLDFAREIFLDHVSISLATARAALESSEERIEER